MTALVECIRACWLAGLSRGEITQAVRPFGPLALNLALLEFDRLMEMEDEIHTRTTS